MHLQQAPSVSALRRKCPSLLFTTPACYNQTRPTPANTARRAPPCGPEVCSIDGHGAAPASLGGLAGRPSRRAVATAASPSPSATAETAQQQGWWKQQAHLWVEVHTEEEFRREIGTGDKLVFVGEFVLSGGARRRAADSALYGGDAPSPTHTHKQSQTRLVRDLVPGLPEDLPRAVQDRRRRGAPEALQVCQGVLCCRALCVRRALCVCAKNRCVCVRKTAAATAPFF